ncbi:MAG TPA: hypothetical protein VFC46_14150 [Humisphaera sp.]|nr:hypothetical protein [Humisphaera sp.]
MSVRKCQSAAATTPSTAVNHPPSLRVVADRRYSRTPPISFSIDLDSIDYD